MISIDFFLVGIAAIGTIVVFTRWKALQKANATLGILLILTGLWTGTFIYIADIYTMTILARVIGMAESMSVMRTLHLSYSWYINTASAIMVLLGLILTVIHFVRQIGVIEANRRALEENENVLDSVFQNVPVGLLIKDSNNVVERANNTYLNWYDLNLTDLVGQRSHEIESFQSTQDAQYMMGQEKQVLMEGTIHIRQVERRLADGQQHIIHITKFPVYGPDGCVAKVGSVSVDITELVDAKHRAENALMKAELANRGKSAFLANMSHELRTPLNAIIGFSETMLAQIFGPLGSDRYREQLKGIHRSGHHLLDLVNDILDLAKTESGQYDLSPEQFNLGEIVSDSVQIILAIADRKHVEIVNQLPKTMPEMTADKRALRQILLNLISNAVKFTPEGGRVSVRAIVNGDDLTINIEDNGIGIPTKDIPDLTKPFNQGSRNRAYTAGEGTGLGLSIVASLVRLHDGKLEINSEVGKGTCVDVFLPGVLRDVDRSIAK